VTGPAAVRAAGGPRRLVVLGPQGAGKGTQGARLAARLGVPAVSTGDIFRANVGGGTELGRTAKTYMDAGELVPDEVTVAMVADRTGQPDAAGGFLLDGFPRNLAQAEALGAMLDGLGAGLDAVLALALADDQIIRRLSGRRVDARTGRVWHVETDPPPAASHSATTTGPGPSGAACRSSRSRPRRWSASTPPPGCWSPSTGTARRTRSPTGSPGRSAWSDSGRRPGQPLRLGRPVVRRRRGRGARRRLGA